MSSSESSAHSSSSLEEDESYSEMQKRRVTRRQPRGNKLAYMNESSGENSESSDEKQVKISNSSSNRRSTRQTRQNQQNKRSLAEEERELDRQLLEAEKREVEKNNHHGESSNEERNGHQIGEGVFNPEIELILWARDKKNGEKEYLTKYKEQSYLHCKWLSEAEVIADCKNGKSKLSRFSKAFQKKIDEGEIDIEDDREQNYFDPSFAEVDRVIQCVEIFPIIHPKKANEIKGKWTELLAVMTAKLLSFSKNFNRGQVHYGTFFMEPVNPERDNCPTYRQVIETPMDLGTLSNRVYLDYYKTFSHFFQEFGLVFKNCRKYNKNPSLEIRILCDTLRESAAVLYREWFEIETRRYTELRDELDGLVDGLKVIKRDEEKLESVQEAESRRRIQAARLGRKAQEILTRKEAGESFSNLKEDIKDLCNSEETQLSVLRGLELKEDQDILQTLEQLVSQNCQASEQDQKQSHEFELRQLVEGLCSAARGVSRKGENLTKEEIEHYNPGEFSLKWLLDDSEISENPSEDQQEGISAQKYQYLTTSDIDKLSLYTEMDLLFLVKWKNSSYTESTWEHQSELNDGSSINDYRLSNRALDKESRLIINRQTTMHNQLLGFAKNGAGFSRANQNVIADLTSKLYNYDIKQYKQVFQYTLKTQVTYKQRKLLRPYQLESLNWMIDAYYNKRNLILADEMGLGKTIQSTAFLNHLYSFEGIQGPFLVISPLSTLQHWKRSVQSWTNLNQVLYYDHLAAEGRAACRHYEWMHTDISTKGTVLKAQNIYKFNVLITSNEVFLADLDEYLLQIPFTFIIVDEAHRLKNQNAKILSALKRMNCKRIMLLTGTPIQNNTEELWTLLNFIEPQTFSSLSEFRHAFGDLKNNEQVQILQNRIKPFLLRRMKEDVEDSIPPLQETIIDIEMTTIQKTLYRALYEKNKSMLQKTFSMSASNAQLNNLAMQLRRCCNHPFLIEEIEEELVSECVTEEERYKKLIECSGKMILLDKLITKCRQEGRKILIFSQFLAVLSLLEEYLRYRQIKYEKIEGSVKQRERQNGIDRFNDLEKKRDVFLLSTKAGGLGINLTSASVVVIFDSDWNPQNDVQACARAHRIGQKNEVQVYRFITKKSYESEMFERATKKLGLGQAIFMGGEFKSTGNSVGTGNGTVKDDGKRLCKAEVESLLKRGILGLMNEEEENKQSSQFFEEDIDSILKNNSRIAKFSVINGSYSFSKGSFVSNKADSDLKIDDPNFWNKVLKDKYSKHTLALHEIQENKENTFVAGNAEFIKKYFFKICNLVSEIITAKLNLTGFNADDERNVIDILNIIQTHKAFPKKYKDIAINFQLEIARPSRRFKKLTIVDLELGNVPKHKKRRSKEERIVPATRSKNSSASKEDNSNNNNDLYLEEEEESEASEVKESDENEEDYEAKETQKQSQLKKDDTLDTTTSISSKTTATINSNSTPPKPSATLVKPNQHNSQQSKQYTSIYSRLCYCCDKSGCSQFCIGSCKRGFHPECRLSTEAGWINMDGLPAEAREVLSENNSSEEELKKITIEFTCRDCQEDKGICFICKRKDTYYHQTTKTHKADIRKSELNKCQVPGCNKFFHQACIAKINAKSPENRRNRFRCAQHYCSKCDNTADSKGLLQCIRCIRACHASCLEGETVLRLSKRVMLCEKHPKDSLHEEFAKKVFFKENTNSKEMIESAETNKMRQEEDISSEGEEREKEDKKNDEDFSEGSRKQRKLNDSSSLGITKKNGNNKKMNKKDANVGQGNGNGNHSNDGNGKQQSTLKFKGKQNKSVDQQQKQQSKIEEEQYPEEEIESGSQNQQQDEGQQKSSKSGSKTKSSKKKSASKNSKKSKQPVEDQIEKEEEDAEGQDQNETFGGGINMIEESPEDQEMIILKKQAPAASSIWALNGASKLLTTKLS